MLAHNHDPSQNNGIKNKHVLIPTMQQQCKTADEIVNNYDDNSSLTLFQLEIRRRAHGSFSQLLVELSMRKCQLKGIAARLLH